MKTKGDKYLIGSLYALEAAEEMIKTGDATALLNCIDECKKKPAKLERGFLNTMGTVVKMDVNNIMKEILLSKFMLEYALQNPGKRLNDKTGREMCAYMIDRVKATVAAAA